MKVLVTGGTGFVGSHLIDRLLARQVSVTALVRSPARAAPLERRGVRLIEGDLANHAALERAVRDQTIIYHVAALTGAVNEAELLHANRDGTHRLVEAAEGAGTVSRFVLVSSAAAGGPAPRGVPKRDASADRPLTMYGRSKLAAEAVVRASPLPWTILRPPAVYGPRDTTNFLAIFRAITRFGVAPVFGNGHQELSLIHVGDLAEACMVAAHCPGATGKVWYVNHPDPVTSRELLRAVGHAVGRSVRVLPLPAWATRGALHITGAWARVLRRQTILHADKANEFLAEAWTGDSTPFSASCGWHAGYSLEQGLADTARWYREERLL
ncbi:MAG TPA: NAD(P)-dependent oxidoreductase [Gemmatimonadales bacterium]|nr:NAD(P)-dependent oxidoreductase [Gemmatimonadales bacterium]